MEKPKPPKYLFKPPTHNHVVVPNEWVKVEGIVGDIEDGQNISDMLLDAGMEQSDIDELTLSKLLNIMIYNDDENRGRLQIYVPDHPIRRRNRHYDKKRAEWKARQKYLEECHEEYEKDLVRYRVEMDQYKQNMKLYEIYQAKQLLESEGFEIISK